MFQVYAENNKLSLQVKPLVNTDVFVEGLPRIIQLASFTLSQF